MLCKEAVASALVLGLHQPHAAVLFPQLGLLDFSGGVTGHWGKNQLAGPLVAGQVLAKLHDLFFRKINYATKVRLRQNLFSDIAKKKGIRFLPRLGL